MTALLTITAFILTAYPAAATPDEYIKVTNQLLGANDSYYIYQQDERRGLGVYNMEKEYVWIFKRNTNGTQMDSILVKIYWTDDKIMHNPVDIDTYLLKNGLKQISPSNFLTDWPYTIIFKPTGMYIRKKDNTSKEILMMDSKKLNNYFSYEIELADRETNSRLQYTDLFCDSDIGRVQICYESKSWIFLYIEFPSCDHTPDVRGIVSIQKADLKKGEKRVR